MVRLRRAVAGGARPRRISWFESSLLFHTKQQPPLRVAVALAESVRFELTVGRPITSFQDWLLKPLGQLSVRIESYHFAVVLSSDRK